ncbi:MAG: PilZ domain-containing protein [Pseudomonadota bacterium]
MSTSSPVESKAYLDRRSGVRVSHHFTARFAVDPDHPLRLGQGLTQDLSLRGVQLLTDIVPDSEKPFDIWIPVDDQEVVAAQARVVWMALEDTYADSQYWLRVGVNLTCQDREARRLLAGTVARKADLSRALHEQENSKVSFVF